MRSIERSFMGLVWSLCLLVSFTLAGAAPAIAQSFYGSILGTVTDPGGAVMPGASLTLTNQGTQERRTVQSDESGNYRFVNLIPGKYRLDVEKAGFKHLDRPDILVEVQADVRIDVTLEVGQLLQTVEVKGANSVAANRHRGAGPGD